MRRAAAFLPLALLLASLAAAQPLADYDRAILVEPTTGTVLFAKNVDKPAPIASMTKMMTALVVLDLIEAGKLDWNDPVSASAYASRMGGSQVYLRHREVFPVRSILAAVLVQSANDAAQALAEHVGGGSDEPFVRMMNAKARALGLRETRFTSPHGLPDGERPDDVSSPRDLWRLGWELMKHPEARKLVSTEKMPFRNGEFILWNPNNLLERYEPAIGIKTGTHDRAGSCVTAAAKKGDMTLIAVVMGAGQRNAMFAEVERMFEEAFAEYEVIEPVRKGTPAARALPVAGGRVPTVAAVAGADARIVVAKDETTLISTAIQTARPPAPVEKGERVGWIVVSKQGTPIGRVPLVATAAVPARTWLQTFWDHVWPW
ncbi:MAG: D-alanyl-D-alanine carboxypeptidase family protein [Thermoanaerobaculia bacterium]